MINLRKTLSFGFEQTFTVSDWWTEPGFVSTSDTPLKREKMLVLARKLAEVSGGSFVESVDIYNHLQYETFEADGTPSFVVTMDPGSIEVKTPPRLIADLEATMAPLYKAAELAEVVTYRSWWYGIKSGTEGGCHVNMAGFTPESNPLRLDPSLVIKYAGYVHNHPWIHYPFMGPDTGPGGNAMRMDEHEEPVQTSLSRYEEARQRYLRGDALKAEEVAEFFRGTKLLEDKHSYPSLYKFKNPAYFIEDRAVESLRAAEEFTSIAELRMRILETLQAQAAPDLLRDFGAELHAELLTSYRLWEEFLVTARELGLDPTLYRRFFDRQFPVLAAGEGVPSRIQLREGRRPRVITGVQKRGDLIISKTVDTRFKRLEIFWENDGAVLTLEADLPGQFSGTLKPRSYLDVKAPEEDVPLRLRLLRGKEVVEEAAFHLKNMMWVRP